MAAALSFFLYFIGWFIAVALIRRWSKQLIASPLVISWSTTSVPHFLRRPSRFLRAWFFIVVPLSVVGLIASCSLLAYNFVSVARSLLDLFSRNDDSAVAAAAAPEMLTIAIPGITLPWNTVLYLWLAIVPSLFFHELGHALAAAAHRVDVRGYGFFLTLGVPGGYVDLDTEHGFVDLPASKKLTITGAGIWHNVVLSCACLLLLALSPALWSPLFRYQVHPAVLSVREGSALASVLQPRALLTGLDGQLVRSRAELEALLTRAGAGAGRGAEVGAGAGAGMGEARPGGWCVPERFLAGSNSSCCVGDDGSSGRQCFRYVEGSRAYHLKQSHKHHHHHHDSGSDGGGSGSDSDSDNNSDSERSALLSNTVDQNPFVCIRAKDAFLSAADSQTAGAAAALAPAPILPRCSLEQPCAGDDSDPSHATCLEATFDDPRLRYIIFEFVPAPGPAGGGGAVTDGGVTDGIVTDASPRLRQVFAGDPQALLSDVAWTDYWQRAWSQQALGDFLMGPHLPEALTMQLRFIVAVSSSVALLNSAPIALSDGAFNAEHIRDMWFPGMKKHSGGGGGAASTMLLVRLTTGVFLLSIVGTLAVGVFRPG
jgi:hypothetical protein